MHEANEALAAHATELERSNAELEQFAYVASHDLQEPLRKVASFSQLLQRRYGGQLDERADQYIDFAVDGATRMQQLINDLLAFSRVGRAGQRSSRSSCDGRARGGAGEPGIQRSTRVRRRDRRRGRCRRCTAQRTLHDGGLPEPDRQRHQVPRRRAAARHVTARPGRRRPGVFAVSDNGIGIDPEYAERIFVIFQRLHAQDDYPGTGHRPGDVPEDRRVPRRPDLAGHAPAPTAPGPVPLHAAVLPDVRRCPQPELPQDRRSWLPAIRGTNRRPAGRGRRRRRPDDQGGVRGQQDPQPAARASPTASRRSSSCAGRAYADAPRPELILLDLNLPRLSRPRGPGRDQVDPSCCSSPSSC